MLRQLTTTCLLYRLCEGRPGRRAEVREPLLVNISISRSVVLSIVSYDVASCPGMTGTFSSYPLHPGLGFGSRFA